MGGDLAYERDCQKHILEAGGFGAMGYIFEWTNTEVFGYLGAQHLWRNRGIPGVSNENQIDILDYSYRLYYGDEVGHLVARAMDEALCVNDAMVLEGVYGSQWPSTGRVSCIGTINILSFSPITRRRLARQAYRRFTGEDPQIEKAAYDQDGFHWNGYEPPPINFSKRNGSGGFGFPLAARRKCAGAALAHRLAQRLIKEGANIGAVLKQFDRAMNIAKKNEFIYQVNYDDDYDWTDGLCSKLTERLEKQRADFLAAARAEINCSKNGTSRRAQTYWDGK